MSTSDQKTLYLVDGSAYIFRAYHALPPLTNREGTPVGAVLGFCNMLTKLLNDFHAPFISVIFDAARYNFRNEIYDQYKANRDEPPEDLRPQFGIIREATKAFGIEPQELEGFEADDLIATYARLATEKGYKVIIVSSDKDLMQLINDNVAMFDPMKNKMMDEEDVIEKFGVKPDKVIDVQSLAGDSIDNVPGVPGIGVKTAAQLINEYGDLETLLERAEEIKQPKRRESLIEHAENARISKKLVSLDAHVDIPVGIDDLKSRDLDQPDLKEFLTFHGFNSILKRLSIEPAKTTSVTPQTPTSAASTSSVTTEQDFPAIADNTYVLINTADVLEDWVKRITEKGYVAIDTETTHLTPARAKLVGISLCIDPGEAAYIPLGHVAPEVDLLSAPQDDVPSQLSIEQAIKILKPVLEDTSVLKIGQNIKYDMQILMAHDTYMTPIDDTMLISYCLDGTQRSNGMDELSQHYLGHAPIPYKEVAGTGQSQITFDLVPIEKALDYAAEDADITLRLWHILKPRLVAEKMAGLYEDLERPFAPVIAKMEDIGIQVDVSILKSMSNRFAEKLAELETKIHEQAGTTFNIASPKQIGEILFDQMGLQGGKKTKTGAWSTNAETLEKLAAEGHKIVEDILEWRQLAKLKSTYTDALQEQIADRSGRVHTSFALAATSTGRLASSDPNLQNIPIRTEEGRAIRTAFVAPEGKVLISVDYSQVELRLAAAMAGIPALQEAFEKGEDIHARTASEMFDTPLADMTPELRRSAKAINFGIIYGISGYGLARQLDISPAEAQSYIKKYYHRFPELATYMETTKQEARDKGYVETLWGRKCYIRGINDKNHAIRSGAERQAINAPLQGTAADIMKKAMINIQREIDNGNIDAKMLIQVHDELIFEADEGKADHVASQVKELMEAVAPKGITLIAESGIAKNWAEAH